MKWNWGKGIALVMICFIAFIMFFVIRMGTDKKLNHDLVTEEYYKQELNLQNEIYAQQNTAKLTTTITEKKIAEGLLLTFPKELETSKIEGNVFLYRPSNKNLDFDVPIVLSQANLLIPDKYLVGGRWNIKVAYTYEGESYLYKSKIMY